MVRQFGLGVFVWFCLLVVGFWFVFFSVPKACDEDVNFSSQTWGLTSILCLIWNQNLNKINHNQDGFVLNSDLLIFFFSLLKLSFVHESNHCSVERAVEYLMAK